MKEFLKRWWELARTVRGIVAGVLALFMARSAYDSAIKEGNDSAYAAGQFVFALLIGWLVFYWVLGGIKRRWERQRPATPQFARPAQSAGVRTQLREDKNARFFEDRSGFLWRKRYWFVGTGCPPLEFEQQQIAALYQNAEVDPAPIAEFPPRRWWLYQGTVYWENGNYSSQDVKALLLQRAREEKRQLDRAHALMAMESEGVVVRREGISKEVKQAVFERDAGRCAECGSPGPLEFDHIIPVALGGATTVNNIQLLCLDCNRKKGPSL